MPIFHFHIYLSTRPCVHNITANWIDILYAQNGYGCLWWWGIHNKINNHKHGNLCKIYTILLSSLHILFGMNFLLVIPLLVFVVLAQFKSTYNMSARVSALEYNFNILFTYLPPLNFLFSARHGLSLLCCAHESNNFCFHYHRVVMTMMVVCCAEYLKRWRIVIDHYDTETIDYAARIFV